VSRITLLLSSPNDWDSSLIFFSARFLIRSRIRVRLLDNLPTLSCVTCHALNFKVASVGPGGRDCSGVSLGPAQIEQTVSHL
jgi:hypothetical protein